MYLKPTCVRLLPVSWTRVTLIKNLQSPFCISCCCPRLAGPLFRVPNIKTAPRGRGRAYDTEFTQTEPVRLMPPMVAVATTSIFNSVPPLYSLFLEGGAARLTQQGVATTGSLIEFR